MFFITCTNHTNEKSIGTDLTISNDSLFNEYYKILNGLKLEYVLYYRELKLTNINMKSYGIPSSDSIFFVDSIKYFDSYNKFFLQDYKFLDWLLGFKSDTLKGGLWRSYHNPVSSYLGECHLRLSNSRAAIILIENYLNGQGIECFECGYKDNDCRMRKYKEIESFLESNKSKDIKTIRNEWKLKNAR
jgi:hypothetical protein